MTKWKIKSWLNWCAQTGVVAGVVATNSVIYASFYFGSTPSLLLCLGIFFTTVFCYALDRYIDHGGSSQSDSPITQKFLFWSGLLFAMFGIVFLVSERPWVGVIFLTSPLGLLLYSSPYLGTLLGSRVKRIKDIPLLKCFYLAAYWSLTVPIVGYYIGHIPSGITWPLTLLFFERILQSAIACDFKDIDADRDNGVITVPVYMGIDRAHWFLQVTGAASLLFVFFAVDAGFMYPGVRWMALHFLGTSVCVYRMSRPGADLRFYAVVIDLLFFLWLPLGFFGFAELV
jgi:4-hydroxybenzoate polyprenyltransferase